MNDEPYIANAFSTFLFMFFLAEECCIFSIAACIV